MKTISLLLVSALISLATFAQSTDERKVMVGGGEMSSYKNLVANLEGSKTHTKLVAFWRSAGMVKTLQGPGPFTVFAPVNDAFTRMGSMPSKTVLNKVLLYHVIDGKWDSNDLKAAINGNGGSVSVKTMQGGYLKFSMNGNEIVIADENGATATLAGKDIFQSNGVTHVVDMVMMPYDGNKSATVSMK